VFVCLNCLFVFLTFCYHLWWIKMFIIAIDWRREPGRPRITWLTTVQHDLKLHHPELASRRSSRFGSEPPSVEDDVDVWLSRDRTHPLSPVSTLVSAVSSDSDSTLSVWPGIPEVATLHFFRAVCWSRWYPPLISKPPREHRIYSNIKATISTVVKNELNKHQSQTKYIQYHRLIYMDNYTLIILTDYRIFIPF